MGTTRIEITNRTGSAIAAHSQRNGPAPARTGVCDPRPSSFANVTAVRDLEPQPAWEGVVACFTSQQHLHVERLPQLAAGMQVLARPVAHTQHEMILGAGLADLLPPQQALQWKPWH